VNTYTISLAGGEPATVVRTQSGRLVAGRRAVALCAVTAGLAAMLVPAAQAATSVVANPSTHTLKVVAAPGRTNGITVTRPGPFVISDTGDTVSPGAGCTNVNATTVKCSTAGITTIAVAGGDHNDHIFYNAGAAHGALFGDDGDDVITLGQFAPSSNLFGGKGNDTLIGGTGADKLRGMAGSDTLNTVDGINGNDTADGGGGVNTCHTDPGDLTSGC
jgi:Ca2+-binding RTX toxin-like protein